MMRGNKSLSDGEMAIVMAATAEAFGKTWATLTDREKRIAYGGFVGGLGTSLSRLKYDEKLRG